MSKNKPLLGNHSKMGATVELFFLSETVPLPDGEEGFTEEIYRPANRRITFQEVTGPYGAYRHALFMKDLERPFGTGDALVLRMPMLNREITFVALPRRAPVLKSGEPTNVLGHDSEGGVLLQLKRSLQFDEGAESHDESSSFRLDGSIDWNVIRYLQDEDQRWIIEERAVSFVSYLAAIKNSRDKWASPSVPQTCQVSWAAHDADEAIEWLLAEAKKDKGGWTHCRHCEKILHGGKGPSADYCSPSCQQAAERTIK